MKKHSMNLKKYILHLKGWIPKNWAAKTIEELEEADIWERHEYSNGRTYKKESMNKEKELDVTLNDGTLTYRNELYHLVWKSLEKYILTDKIGGENFQSWAGFSRIRFNRYKKNQIMSKHCDLIHSLFPGKPKGVPILSIVAALNDNYKGGEFIMFDDYQIKIKTGDVLIFPSTFLYPHLVKPVTKGTRYSFVSWCF